MEFVDTHCHIHFPDYELDPEAVVKDAQSAGVNRLLCVGCTLEDSRLAIDFAAHHDNVWAAIGLHPHEGLHYVHDHHALQQFRDLAAKPKVVAIGETGLDYHYNHSPAKEQRQMLRFQLDLAVEHSLPLIFHIREAFDDFWSIFDDYQGLQGVIHSFTADSGVLEQALARGLYIGLNGIMTFTKDTTQLEAAKVVPLKRLILETDAPFLTPTPYRGTICEPKHVRTTAEFLAKLRNEDLAELARETTANARQLFNL